MVWAGSMLGVMRTMWTSVVEEVCQQDAKRDEGVVIAKCIGPRNVGTSGANHVEVDGVCANDQAVRQGWHSCLG